MPAQKRKLQKKLVPSKLYEDDHRLLLMMQSLDKKKSLFDIERKAIRELFNKEYKKKIEEFISRSDQIYEEYEESVEDTINQTEEQTKEA